MYEQTYVQQHCQMTLDTYINICPEIDVNILESTSSYPSACVTIISYPFHISFKQPFANQFSHHILSNVFDQTFHFSAVFQYRPFDLFYLSCNMPNINTWSLIKSLKRQQFQKILKVVASASHRNAQIPKHSRTEIICSSLYAIPFNFADR